MLVLSNATANSRSQDDRGASLNPNDRRATSRRKRDHGRVDVTERKSVIATSPRSDGLASAIVHLKGQAPARRREGGGHSTTRGGLAPSLFSISHHLCMTGYVMPKRKATDLLGVFACCSSLSAAPLWSSAFTPPSRTNSSRAPGPPEGGTPNGRTRTARVSSFGVTLAHAIGGNSLKGLKTFNPGRRKSLSFPVTMVSPCLRAVAAM